MSDQAYINLCIELAKKSYGLVSPNPLVGCVIVKNEKIIGSGFHQKYGDKHAEINAIESAKQSLEGATLYVNLEPCSHFGKTPPCVDRIIKSGIKRVVVGTIDPNPLVSGRGIESLKNAGINVTVGILEEESYQLNKFFFKFIKSKIPYINLKIAQTLDGFIADKSNNSKWISSASSRKLVHSMRAQYDAVLIGVNTANIDDPLLNVRLTDGRNPLRIILDSDLRINNSLKLITRNKDEKTFIVCSEAALLKNKNKIKYLQSKGVKLLSVKKNDSGLDLKMLLSVLGKQNISSILVEGGAKIFSSFLKKKLWDEINLFISPKIMGDGLAAFAALKSKNFYNRLQFKKVDVEKIENDTHIIITKN